MEHLRFNAKRLFMIFILGFVLWRPLTSATPFWVETVMALTINGQFQKAENFLHQKIAESDSALAPCFYLASVLNSKMTFFETQQEAEQFVRLLKFIIRQTNQKLKQAAPSDSLLAHLYFYRGSAYGYLAYFQGQNGQWFAALKNGLKAVNNLKKSVSIDSTLYAAYLGLGTYKYWRSTKLKFALWLPFVPDQRAEGIRDIKRALRSTSNSRYMALHQLVYILTDYGRYNEALRYAQEGIKAFPQSQFLWWAYAHTYFKMHDYPDAAQTYGHLLRLIENDPSANISHRLACQVRLAEIYLRMGKRQKARQWALRALQNKDEYPQTKRNDKRLNKAKSILQQTKK